MAGNRIQPNFRRFAPLQSEPAKGSLDPYRKDGLAEPTEATKKRKTLSISQYQDPRDQLDHERHAMFARARQQREGTGVTSPDAKDQ